MSKKFTKQYCVHCLNFFNELTSDHIFPESWYPDSTPINMEKWVAPACEKCNNELGKIEENVYKKLALSVSSDDIAASGISEKVNLLYNPNFSKNEKSRMRKESNIRKIKPDLFYTKKMPKGILKNCGPRNNEHGKLLLVHISTTELLDPFYKKILRGLEYKFRNKLIDLKRIITIVHPPLEIEKIAPFEISQLDDILKRDGVEINRGPGFVVRFVVDINNTSLYHILIWGKIETWCTVSDL